MHAGTSHFKIRLMAIETRSNGQFGMRQPTHGPTDGQLASVPSRLLAAFYSA